MESVEHWSKITLLVDVKRATEINIEVIEIDGDSIAVWDPPRICILFGVHVERFKCWEIHDNLWSVISISHSKFNVLEIKLWFIVSNISPIDVPG